MLISTSTNICNQVLGRSEIYYTCEDALRIIAGAGFPAVDLCFVGFGRPGRVMDTPDWRDWVKKQKELADSLGLITNQAHAHYYPQTYTMDQREEAQAIIRRDIEAAGMCGVPWIVIHPDSYLEGGNYSRKKSLKLERERFLRLGETAAKFGVGLAIENMIDNKPLKRFAGSHEDLLELLELLGDDRLFGICWDTGHANENQNNQGEAIRAIGSHLHALHVNDNHGLADDHTLPYLGNIDWAAVMGALKDIGYQDGFTYEIHHFTDGMPPAFHPQAVGFAYEMAKYLVSLTQ